MMEDNEEEEDDDMYPEYGDTAAGEAEAKGTGEAEDEEASDVPADDIRPSLMHTEKQKVKMRSGS
jgi:hypothetical protein